jgi:diaminohydroxyphosphoribosylaminopyrimidine deaminase / 5-amino-6-(5-phosphoribosylamino)uracil reductase
LSHPEQDEKWMIRALELARAGVGLASPNPHVGAVVLDANGSVAGEGAHTYAGVKHAEVLALEQAGQRARGGTLYLNLEPCSHHGRTGPCADAVIAAGVKLVVAAIEDPNPAVSGRGFERLREAGIEVTVGMCERKAQRLNEGFAKWIRTGRPFVTLKSATSREGFIAPLDRTRISFTGAEANAFVQDLRHANDAIVVGVGTVLADDPLLTDRSGKPRRRPLVRVVLDSRLRIPLTSQVVTSAADDVVVFCCDGNSEHRRELEQRGVRVEIVPEARGLVDLRAVLERLGREKILSVMIEGGAEVNRNVLENDLADKIIVLKSPRSIEQGLHWTGGAIFDEAKAVETNEHRFGKDTATEFYIHNPYA